MEIAIGLALASVLAIAHAVAFAFGYAVWKGRVRAGYAALATFAVPGLCGSLIHVAGDPRSGLIIFVFALGILPVVNAAFDYLSCGVTLSLLRAGRAPDGPPTWLCGFADIVAALVILFGLALTLALIVARLNALAPVPILPLEQLVADLAAPETRGGCAWLCLSLLSTLIPTAVHLALVPLSAMTWVPAALKRWFVDRIEDDGRDLSSFAAIVPFAALLTLYAVALVWIGLRAAPWLVENFEGGAMLLLNSVVRALTLLTLI